jgi:iron(III) transport system ATP-binding protein
VTHDQEEALSLADRVALMCDGRIEQVDTPEGLYGRPASRWAAGFLGEVEVLSGEAEDGRASCELGSVSARAGLSGPVDILIRPESLAVGIQPPAGTSQRGVVVARRFYGHDQLIEVELESGRRLRSRRLGHQSWHTGDRVHVWIEGPVDVLPPDRPGRRPGRATQAEDAVPGPS